VQNIKLEKEMTLVVEERESSYGITTAHVSIGIKQVNGYDSERVDIECQTDKDNNHFYALKSRESIYLKPMFGDRKAEIVALIFKQYKAWARKNEDITSEIRCELALFKMFLNRKFKLKTFTNWESFRVATWPEFIK
jgi:hypothetical protein